MAEPDSYHCPLLGRAIEVGPCMDISAHALGIMNLSEDDFIVGRLGPRRHDRDALGGVCGSCGNLQWGSPKAT